MNQLFVQISFFNFVNYIQKRQMFAESHRTKNEHDTFYSDNVQNIIDHYSWFFSNVSSRSWKFCFFFRFLDHCKK